MNNALVTFSLRSDIKMSIYDKTIARSINFFKTGNKRSG